MVQLLAERRNSLDLTKPFIVLHYRFKDRASARMLEVWDAWLQVPEVKQDPGYDSIKGVVRQFVPSPAEENQSKGMPGKQTERRRKKKSAKKRAAAKKTGKK